jgi:hypothetical protein
MNTKGKAENLRPFQPGKSGNPGGRPRKLVTEELQKILASKTRGGAKKLAEAMFRRATEDSFQDSKEILDRVEGKVTENKGDERELVVVTCPLDWTPRKRPGQQAIDATPPKTNGHGTLELESKNLLRGDPDGSNNDTDR